MKLKTLIKTIVDTKYCIKVFNDDGFYNDYTVDYLATFNGIKGGVYSAPTLLPEKVLNSKVKFISYNHASFMINISVEL